MCAFLQYGRSAPIASTIRGRHLFPAFIRIIAGLSLCAAQHAWTELTVYPSKINLEHGADIQRLIVIDTDLRGVAQDVTHEARVTVDPPRLARWDRRFRVIPAGRGEGIIHVQFGGSHIRVPLRVGQAEQFPPISFRNDVEPVLMRAGCNAGSCHGSFQGKNGFRLSLFGFDPQMDLVHLTRQARGRRVNPAEPAQSLMLLKPTGTVDHEGGKRFELDSPLYAILHRWIEEGARDDPDQASRLLRIEILPGERVVTAGGQSHRLVVQAHYENGSDRDVTGLALLRSGDDNALTVDGDGVFTARTPAETYVMARFGGFTEVAQVIVLSQETAARAMPSSDPANYIDDLVQQKLHKLRIAPTKVCSDAIFVRRAYLDIIGLLPTPRETRAFAEDTNPGKRARLVDRLLDRPEFADVWAMKWAEVLQVRSSDRLDPKGMYRYNDWLRQSIASGKPANRLARELLGATGGSFGTPEANFFLLEEKPAQIAENVAQVFMGVQIKCAQCHNHPFERWTMDDYYSFAAFFAQVGRKVSSDPRETIVFNRGSGEVINIRSGQAAVPKFLGGAIPEVQGRDRRAVLAEWLTSPDNPWFANNLANRVWEHFLGTGIVEPVDDVRVSNPPSNPKLLGAVAARLVKSGYDIRELIRDICHSNTYQRATPEGPADPAGVRNFARARVRRLPSETLLDAISRVTGSPFKFPGLPLGAGAAQIANGVSGNYFLDVFGRPRRDTSCTCERRNEPTLAQVLHLINGDTLQRAIGGKGGRLSRLFEAEYATQTIVEDLYLSAYSRPPGREELLSSVVYVARSGNRREALEDLYWSVLNSKEFLFNH